MTKEEILFLRNMLLDRRSTIVERVRRLAAAWHELEEPAIELEEEAQKASIAKPYDELDKNGKVEIEQIDLALIKITVGDYGICEACGDDIAHRRLQAIPWARLCVECAREYEKQNRSLPQTSDIAVSAKIPDEFHGLTNQQIVSLIYERLQTDERVDTEDLRLSFRKGVVFLDGAVETEAEHDLIVQILADSMGFSSVVDHIGINEMSIEADEISEGSSEEDDLDRGLFYDRDSHEEAFEAKGVSPLNKTKDDALS
ncbi:Transcriptional regulator, TraR/DksA family [Syntrophobacter sp. SbD1]|nr:Transcriptional regulator, TraR/DksA family [Syntrophobacter sp. SbD1]